MKNALKFFFDTWYGAALVVCASYGLTLLAMRILGARSGSVRFLCLAAAVHAALVLAVLAAAVRSLAKRRWWRAVAQFIVCAATSALSGTLFTVAAFSLFMERACAECGERQWQWRGEDPCEALPFSVEYRPSHPFLAEYDKRVTFKSGKSVGLVPDTGGAGDFAAYALPDGRFYLVDGMEYVWIRSEYRVDAVSESVEKKCGTKWVKIPDGSLGVTSWGVSGLTVETASGRRNADSGVPVGDSLAGKRYVGRVTTLGEFIAGGPEPAVREDETIWETCRMTDAVPFAYECGKSLSGRRFARISFGSGKTVGIPHGSVHGAFAVYRLPDGRFLLTSREGTMWEEAYRIDADEESVGMIVDGKFARIPDGATGIREIRRGGSDGNFSFCAETPDGDVEISGTEPVDVLYLGARYIGTVTEDCLFRTGEDVAFASAFSGCGDGSAAAGGDPEPDLAGLIDKLRRLGEEKLKKAIDDAPGWSVSWEGRAGDRAFRVFRSGGETCVASFALDGDAADWTVETEGRCNAPEAARHAAAVAAYGELKRLAK